MELSNIRVGSVIAALVVMYPEYDKHGIMTNPDAEKMFSCYEVDTIYKGEFTAKVIENTSARHDTSAIVEPFIHNRFDATLLKY